MVNLLGERRVEHDSIRLGVGPEVGELLLPVPVVGVDRNEADLEACEDCFEVLGAVVEVEGDSRRRAEAGIEEGGGDAGRPLVEGFPREPAHSLYLGQRPGL